MVRQFQDKCLQLRSPITNYRFPKFNNVCNSVVLKTFLGGLYVILITIGREELEGLITIEIDSICFTPGVGK